MTKTEEKKYTPKMMKLSNVEATISEVKQKIPQSLYIAQQNKDICIFTANPHFVKQVTEHYPKATIEIVESNEATFKKAIKEQAQQNFECFQLRNAAADKVMVILKSAASDCQVEPAMKYAKAVLAGLKTPQEVSFVVRGWLLDTFKQLQSEKSVPFQFEVISAKPPRNGKLQKTIIMKAVISVKDVPHVINAVQKLERIPTTMFASDAPRPKREFKPREGQEKRVYKPKEKDFKPKDEKRKPNIDKSQSVQKPKQEKPKEEKPKSAAFNKTSPKTQEIVIEIGETQKKAKVNRVIIDLQPFPKGTAEKLEPTLIGMVSKTAKVVKMSRGDISIEDAEDQTEYLESIKRIKINGANLAFKK